MFKALKQREVSMRDKFIVRVLLPPFLLLVVIGGIGYWQLNSFLTTQAIQDLQTAAEATAIRLERETAIRETVLKNTGEEIAQIKNSYLTDLADLENNRTACREYYLARRTFFNAPNGVCDIFRSGTASLATIEDGFIAEAKRLQSTEISQINQRLAAYKQFFPETIVIMVTGGEDKVVSSAVSANTNLSADSFSELATQAITEPVNGSIVTLGGFKLAVFAFPTSEGSVLAAYDVNDANFLIPSWQSTPINTSEALAIITEADNHIVYPAVSNEFEVLAKTQGITSGTYETIRFGRVDNIVVAQGVEKTNWSIIIASPEAIVLAPVRDAQFIALVIAGLFVVGFLWVGSFFIKKTTDNIAQLVTGAMVFGSGRLDYTLSVDATEKEFRQLTDIMNAMAQRIAKSEKQNDERNKEFISIATHELRAPMTSIIGYLSMLKENEEKKLSKQNKLLLNSAYDGTIRLRELVNDMLDAARLEGGREEFIYKNVAITQFVQECIDSMEIVAKEKKVKLSYEAKGAEAVYADEGKVRIILNNFVSNAIKYNHSGGYVKVRHMVNKDQLVTSVANSGPTIPADQQEHMFQKFFRVDTPEHKKVTGTGVGMYVTKQYVLAMGGKIWFTSSPGQDNVFYFSLPIAGKQVQHSEPKKMTHTPSDSKWIMRWRKRLK